MNTDRQKNTVWQPQKPFIWRSKHEKKRYEDNPDNPENRWSLYHERSLPGTVCIFDAAVSSQDAAGKTNAAAYDSSNESRMHFTSLLNYCHYSTKTIFSTSMIGSFSKDDSWICSSASSKMRSRSPQNEYLLNLSSRWIPMASATMSGMRNYNL